MADILVIDDQDRTIGLCRQVMPEHRWHGPARSWAEALDELERLGRQVDLVLLDVHFDIPASALLGVADPSDPKDVARARRRQGVEILAALRRSASALPVVLMTSGGGVALERAADQHRAEEYTYFLDDDDLDARSLQNQVEGILQASQGTERDGPVYWGRALPMQRIRQRLSVLARGRLPIVLQGPTGTGKSLIARHFVHPRSGRKGPFVAVDLSTVPPDLVAAALFGAVRGAYTGAVADRPGAFEEADGGTLFLDEIGNLSDGAQKMLLSVLQEGSVTRVGTSRERRVDVKLVVATNEDLVDRVRTGRFRADLYMRLNPACTVQLPALAERTVDLDRLVRFCAGRALQQAHLKELVAEWCQRHDLPEGRVEVVTGGSVPDARPGSLFLLLSTRTMGLLRRHRWPGNLRELAMAVENAATFALAEALSAPGPSSGRVDVIQVRPKVVRDLLLSGAALQADEDGAGWRMEVGVQAHGTLNKVAQDVERQYFTRLYLQQRGDFAGMARVLLGDGDGGRKVQLRFNQLGLRVRQLKDQLA